MIIFIITLAAAIVGVWLADHARNEAMGWVGFLLLVCGGLTGFVMTIFIAVAHFGVDAQIEKNRIEYEALCERQEIANSDYEDVSKSDVIKDIAEWNKMVYSSKHWAYNPWTSWFYSRRVVDELEVIERGQNEITR